jgi:hypothetical protein
MGVVKPENVHTDWLRGVGADSGMARAKRIGQPQKACLFCGAKANSREDVWPVWILERFQGPTFGLIGTVGDSLYLDGKQKKVRLRCVCIPCNTGWMSDVEKEAGPILSLMAQDFALSLTQEQRALITAWAVMRAMLWEYFAPAGRRPYYLDWDRADMRTGRKIPENTTVWLARYGGLASLWSFLTDATADPRHPVPDATARAVLTTLVFGRLCIQVMSYRTLMAESVIDMTPLPGPWDNCAVTIWPPARRHVVDWPPRLTLERDVSFDSFRRRWRQHPGG